MDALKLIDATPEEMHRELVSRGMIHAMAWVMPDGYHLEARMSALQMMDLSRALAAQAKSMIATHGENVI